MPDIREADIERGRELLEKHGLHGLTSMLMAAITEAKQSDPRRVKLLFRAFIADVLQIVPQAGLEMSDVIQIALDMVNQAAEREIGVVREIGRQKRADELAEIEAENAKHGL